jgi:hypothetical protein
LAGDIGHPILREIKEIRDDKVSSRYSINPSFLYLLKKFKERYPTTIFVPGNHEYYQAKELKVLDQIDTIDNVMRLACEEAKVIFLNCDQWMDPKTGIEVDARCGH